MRRRVPKKILILAKQELFQEIPTRIFKNATKNGCWYFKSKNETKVVDFVCHFSNKGKNKIFFAIKRLAYEFFLQDELSEDLLVYSKCGDKFCINPEHHYVAPLKDHAKKVEKEGKLKRRKGFKHSMETKAKMSNARKGIRLSKATRKKMSDKKKGVERNPDIVARTAEKHFRGENNACAKLTEKQVLEIRSKEGSISSRELANYYPVTHSHIRSIWRRSTWKHI